MQKIVFATNNKKKLTEVRAMLKDRYEVLSLEDVGCTHEVEETGDTFQENAMLKAKHVKEVHGYNCFADDSGLEVAVLNGAPGVYSARFAGPEKNDLQNNLLLLARLKDLQNRKANFKTVIALLNEKGIHFFEGIVDGNIAETMAGDEGFGYDPLFVPEGYSQTFAQMSMETKNKISHRAKAVNKLVDFLKKQN